VSFDDPRVQDAVAFAREAYERATGDDCDVAHVLQVGRLLAELGCSADVVTAGVLHDVVEDTYASHDAVRRRFGVQVAGLVQALTEDPEIPDYAERKRALRQSVRAAGIPALVVFAADKLARLRAADRDAVALDGAQLQHYRRSLELLMSCGVRNPHVDELAARLRARYALAGSV
jgi:(p)ppGpp synthase/HD superfamily hydrolase